MNIKDLLLGSLQSKGVRYGGYASLITFAVIVGLIVVNLIVQQFDVQADMTENSIYTLSDQTREIIDSLEQDVDIYVTASRGDANQQLLEALQVYGTASPRIAVEVIDVDTNPGFASQYDPEGEGLRNGSIVVAGEDNFRVIQQRDLYSISYRNPNNPQVLGLNVERRITNALIFVATGETPTVYELTGQGEVPLSRVGIAQELERDNYEVESINLIQESEVPSDAAILAVIAPRSDITPAEADKIRSYLDEGGRGFFAVDLSAGEIPNINALLEDYGVRYNRGVVIEGDDRYHTGNQFYLVPDLAEHEILEPLSEERIPVMFPISMPVEPVEPRRRTLTLEPLLTSSEDSWLRTDLESDQTERIEGDVDGPHTLAMAVWDRDSDTGESTTRIIVTGSANYLGPIGPYGTVRGNTEFFLNSASWLHNRQDTISIRPKFTFLLPMNLNQAQILIFSGVFIVLIPLGLFVGALVVWLRRRHL
jgi:hypothetical protein